MFQLCQSDGDSVQMLLRDRLVIFIIYLHMHDFFSRIIMKELCRYVHRSKIGVVNSGKFSPRIYFNFEFTLYVSNSSVKVNKLVYLYIFS